MSDLQDRISGLSPEKRRLLEKRMQERGLEFPNSGQPVPLTPRGDHAGPLPLSYGQQRLWFLQQLFPENLAYNNVRTLRIRGTLDRAALRQTFDELLARHEVLRTTYGTESGRPVQIVHAPASFPLKEVDLRTLPPGERMAAFRERHAAGGSASEKSL
jgi:hypothetical protein